MYHQVAVESQIGGHAGAHRLVSMLFDGLFESIAQARGAMRSGDVTTKGRALTRAAAIIEEGLRAALDLHNGGVLARDLHELYAYVTLRLTQANLQVRRRRPGRVREADAAPGRGLGLDHPRHHPSRLRRRA